MKKLLLPFVLAVAGWLMPLVSSSQTYSSWGAAVNNGNNLYDTVSTANDQLLFRFANTHSIPFGTATLVVYYEGYYGDDYLNLYDESTSYRGITNSAAYNCAPEDSTTWLFTSSEISSWNADDSIDFLLVSSNGPGFCALNRVRVKLTYNYCLNGPPAQYATLSINDTSVCALDGTHPLTGLPAGGVFSGTGVSGSTFDPTNLQAGSYMLYYTATDSIGCSTTGSLNVNVGSRPEVNNNNTVYTCNGTSVNLNATHGSQFVWFSDAALTQVLDTANTYTTPALTQNTTYYVASIDYDETFRVDTLEASNYVTVDEDNLAGDDRGGMAITHTHVYLNGDNACVRYDLDLTPSSGVPLQIRDGMFSDLRSAKIWTLWNNTMNIDPQNAPGQFTVEALRGLDSNLNVTSEMIQLSQPIDMGTNNQQNGIFAGYGYLGLYSGNTQHWYIVDMDNGEVLDLGYLSDPEFDGSENWSDWGTLESDCNGNFSAIYRDYNDANIHRRVLPNGPVTSVGNFPDLSDMASLTFCPWNNRWYWHYEGSSSTFGGSSETLGYADAANTEFSCGVGLSCATMVTVNVPTDVAFTLPSTTLCFNDGPVALNQGTPAGGTYSGVGVGTNSTGTVFFPALAGNGAFTITYTFTDTASGCTDFATQVVNVNACTGVDEQTLTNGISIYPNPNNGTFTVGINATAADLLIEVTDLQGRIVFSSKENNVTPGFAKQINLDNVADGVYLMKVTAGNEQQVQKVTIQR